MHRFHPFASFARFIPLLVLAALAACDRHGPILPPAAPSSDVGLAAVPNAPDNVTAAGISAGKVNVGWADNSSDETFFRIRRVIRQPNGSFGGYVTLGTRGTNNTSFVDSTVVIGETYRYYVYACNADGCGISPPSPALTVMLPPNPPLGIGAQVLSTSRVDVAWVDSLNTATSYRVRRSTRNPNGSYAPYVTIGTVGAAVRTFSDTGVAPGGYYRYYVQACNGGGCATSDAVNINVPFLPAAPTGLGATIVSASRVDLAWTDASTNESQFRIRRSTRNPDGTFPAATTIGTRPAGSTTFVDSTVVAGNVYRYQVQACNASGCANSGAVVVTVPFPPAAPTGVTVQAVSSSQVNAGWTDASTNESSFRVRRTIRNPDGSYAPYQTVATLGAGVTSYQDMTVTAGATHRYIIQACNTGGCVNSPSVSVTVPGS